MKTLVITPPFLESFRPPISGAIICAVAKQAGHDVTAWDPNILIYNAVGPERFFDISLQFIGIKESVKADYDFVTKFLTNYDFSSYDYILISVFSKYEVAATEVILKHLRAIKSNAKIVLGGPGIEQNVDQRKSSRFGKLMKEQGLCSHYILGEGEIALLELFKGNINYPGIDGTPAKQIDDVDSLPFPDYDFYTLKNYDSLIPNDPDLFVYGSRGCVRNCAFCDVPVYWPKYRYRSGKNIAEELIRNWEKYGIKHFFFTDSLVNGSLKAYTELHETIAKKSSLPKFRIAGYAIIRPKNQHPKEMFDMMANTGTHLWSIGIEHGSDAMRFDMNKKFTNDDIDWHLEQSERIKLDNHWLLMPTWVNEKLEHHEEYLSIFKRWQKYVANKTIVSAVMSPTLMMLNNTPLLNDDRYEIEFDNDENNIVREALWINKNNPELTYKERYVRAVAIWEEAIKYRWPMTQAQEKLLSMHSFIKKNHYSYEPK